MEHDNSDDPWGFWNDEPTRPLKRAHVGTRAHGETSMVPVVRTQRAKAVPDTPRQRNPLMTRVCVMVGVMLLCVPIALTLRQGKQQAKAAEVQGVDTVFVGKMPPAPAELSLAPDTAAPTTLVSTTAALATTAAPTTPAPTLAALATAAPTAPPTTAKVVKKKAVAKTTTTTAPPTTATQAVAKVACTQTYTVASGDAWSTIAARAKVSMTSLLAANGATVQTLLLSGKKICLPAGAVVPGPPTTKPPTTTTTTKPPATKPPTTAPKVTAPPTTKPSTTPTVTTAPATTQPPPPANTYSKAQVAQIIRDVWPDNLEDQAIAIATRESNLVPTVRNYCCYGLFQIYYTAHQTWLAAMGITSAAQLYDPRVNATAALALYNSNGWAPWALPPPVVLS